MFSSTALMDKDARFTGNLTVKQLRDYILESVKYIVPLRLEPEQLDETAAGRSRLAQGGLVHTGAAVVGVLFGADLGFGDGLRARGGLLQEAIGNAAVAVTGRGHQLQQVRAALRINVEHDLGHRAVLGIATNERDHPIHTGELHPIDAREEDGGVADAADPRVGDVVTDGWQG